MEARHVYIKGRSGNGVFYRAEDFLVYITIISPLVREMRLSILAFCPMFNHIHLLFKDIGVKELRRFVIRSSSVFTKEYNREYERSGALFKRPFGESIKKGIKVILGCVAYVFNNSVAGRLCGRAIEYRWSLLAYNGVRNPFSEKLRKDKCRNVMRIALRKVDYFIACGKHLNYNTLREIFEGLDSVEKNQMIDYILFNYNFLDFDSLERLYGGYQRLLISLESNAGAEFELEDEYGDHSCYRKMLSIAGRLGYKGKKLNFERLPPGEREELFRTLRRGTGASYSCIKKFLHIEELE